MVIPSLLAVQTHPRYWEPEPLAWRPYRWIQPPASHTQGSKVAQEQLLDPIKGTYFPWSEGSQHCPGKSFAKAEFVAVIACLFPAHRVRAHLLDGETPQQAKERLVAVAEDSEVALLLRMRHADDVRLVWEKRG